MSGFQLRMFYLCSRQPGATNGDGANGTRKGKKVVTEFRCDFFAWVRIRPESSAFYGKTGIDLNIPFFLFMYASILEKGRKRFWSKVDSSWNKYHA